MIKLPWAHMHAQHSKSNGHQPRGTRALQVATGASCMDGADGRNTDGHARPARFPSTNRMDRRPELTVTCITLVGR